MIANNNTNHLMKGFTMKTINFLMTYSWIAGIVIINTVIVIEVVKAIN